MLKSSKKKPYNKASVTKLTKESDISSAYLIYENKLYSGSKTHLTDYQTMDLCLYKQVTVI